MKYTSIIVLFSLILIPGCANLGSPDPVYNERPNGDVSMGTQYTFSVKGWEGRLKKAHFALQNSQFEKAVFEFEDIFKQAGEAKYKEEALYYLGVTHSAMNNPGKDFKKAVFYFNLLIETYPLSGYRQRAEDQKKSLALIEERNRKDSQKN